MYKHRQSDEAIFVSNAEFSGRLRFIAGDFNFPPDQLYPNTSTRAMDIWYAAYWEAAGRLFSSGSHFTFAPSSKKLDYVWMDKTSGDANPLAVETSFLFYSGSGVSDHALLKGRFLI